MAYRFKCVGAAPLISLNDSTNSIFDQTQDHDAVRSTVSNNPMDLGKHADLCKSQSLHLNSSDSAIDNHRALAVSCESVLSNPSHLTVPFLSNIMSSSPINHLNPSPFLSPDYQLSPNYIAQQLSLDTMDYLLSDKNQLSKMLIIDCRVFVSYNLSHIKTALNVHCPSIVKRRIRGAGMPLEYIVPCMTQRTRLQAGEVTKVVVYDQDSNLPSPMNNRPSSVGSSTTAESTLVLVLRSLTQILPADSLYFLQGGYNTFSQTYPQHIITPSTPKHTSLSLAGTGLCLHPMLHGRTHSDSCLHGHGSSRHIRSDPVEILPWLYLGDVDHASGKSMRCHGFTALLNVSNIAIRDPLPHVTYKQIKVADDAEADLKTWFPEAVAFIDNVRTCHGKVLVHCKAGISRSATVCIAYLMYHKHFSLEQGHAYVKARRNIIDPNFNFMQQLQEYESLLSENRPMTSPQSPPISELSSQSGGSSSGGVATVVGGTPIVLPSPITPVSSCQSQVFVFDSPLSSGLCHSPLLSPS